MTLQPGHPQIVLTDDERAIVAAYRVALAKRDRLDAAESRAFVAYFCNRTASRASTARSAKSRVNAFSAEFHRIEGTVYDLMDALADDGRLPAVYHYDPARFAEEVTN